MVPHQHHDELSDEDHEVAHRSADGLLDYLGLIFHVDMGDGHLEHFDTNDALDLDDQAGHYNAPGYSAFIEVDPVVSSTGYDRSPKLFHAPSTVPKGRHLVSSGLRGPPIIS